MNTEYIVLIGILSFVAGIIVATVILGKLNDQDLKKAMEIMRQNREEFTNCYRNAMQIGLNEGIKSARGLRKQLDQMNVQYRQLKSTSKQRKEIIERMSQFLSPEEMDRVYHEKGMLKNDTQLHG